MSRELTPAEFREKQARRLKGSLEDIRKGVDAVTESPTKKAAENIDLMKAKLDEAFASGKVKRRLEAVTVDDWKKDMQVGVGRIGAGIDANAAKVENFAAQALPRIYALQREVKKMPKMTIEDSLARMEKQMRGMKDFEFKR